MADLSNVNVVRKLLLASNRGDVDAVIACVHPEVEWSSVGLFLSPAKLWRGRAELRSGLEQRVDEHRGHPQVTLRELAERDPQVLVVGAIAVPRSRRPVVLPVAWIFELDGGRVRRATTFANETNARAEWAVGSPPRPTPEEL